MLIEESRFRQIVTSALKDLSTQVDKLDTDAFDSKYTEGVFQIDWEGGGVFVLSQQVPVRELWLSAFSRAWHFTYADGVWSERDTEEPLHTVLSAHFSKRMGRPVVITNPGPRSA